MNGQMGNLLVNIFSLSKEAFAAVRVGNHVVEQSVPSGGAASQTQSGRIILSLVRILVYDRHISDGTNALCGMNDGDRVLSHRSPLNLV